MKVLLLSMPDSFEHTPADAVRMPNAALTSLAGNVDRHHQIAVADLILVQSRVRETVTRLVAEQAPDVVGLSIMTFQRKTAKAIIRLVRSLRPSAHIVVGGYDPSLAVDAYTDLSDDGADFIVRGEGEITFRQLLCAIESGKGYDGIAGLSFRKDGGFQHNSERPISRLDDGDIRLPDRSARVLTGYTMLGQQADVVETSRGCTFDCSFCSIISMRGRNFNPFNFDRVLNDIRDAYDRGARTIFIVDDNITLNVRRFAALCQAIIDAGLNSLSYTVQAMTSAIADRGEWLAPLMRKAGFKYVFLGIENVLAEDLAFLRARAKNAKRENGRRGGNASETACDYLRRNGLYVVGGLIVGNPDDTQEAVEANLEFARRCVDWPYIQHPTPYPGTQLERDLRYRGLISNYCVEEYDGTTSVVRCQHMEGEEIEFMRWRAERWMKARHFWALFQDDPVFALRSAPRMFAFTFRGCTMRSLLGLESELHAFGRYRAIRTAERNYL
jgi:anaerobic magnesium-protoporphyrin IX monomethyl ester cyclase